MAPPGLASIEAGRRSGLRTFMDDVAAMLSPPDLEEALTGRTARNFAAYPDACKRNALRWLKLAKAARTRSARIAKIVEAATANARIPQM